jgi:hypothetical protein
LLGAELKESVLEPNVLILKSHFGLSILCVLTDDPSRRLSRKDGKQAQRLTSEHDSLCTSSGWRRHHPYRRARTRSAVDTARWGDRIMVLSAMSTATED